MKSNAIRQAFIDFFHQRGHQIVPSSSLVPGRDATLLFTNSGMVQFKDVFLGLDQRPYHRAVTAQRCLRAGGKHNDLENVGYTLRHHTFFEMLGNFSFGDYFKKEAIRYAWELLTKVFGLDPVQLWVTVYQEDDEAYDLWRQDIGIPAERIVRIGDKSGAARYQSDNFWQMADTGPCGPCSEIFFDKGPSVAGGPPGSADEDGDRFVEIWNLVFMQYNRDAAGTLHPLPRPSVDTGMGLERVSAVLQNVASNYDIDLFVTLTQAVIAVTGTDQPAGNPSVRVVADHLRASAFLVADGVLPDNEGRGYVLRRILRRAALHGHKLGCQRPFIHELVPVLVHSMGDAYPQLTAALPHIQQVLKAEEERFAQTLHKGLGMLEEMLPAAGGTLAGEVAFHLYDTHGFPLDLTADICRERGVTLDNQGFEQAMDNQRERARNKSSFQEKHQISATAGETCFHGYEVLRHGGRVASLQKDGAAVSSLTSGDEGMVFLSDTPFYGEAGGQVGDRGVIVAEGARFAVRDTQRFGKSFAHIGRVEVGTLTEGQQVEAQVDEALRAQIARNHSVTHLMHKALREVLGEHVHQRGSQVNELHTRFDFSHGAPLSEQQIHRVEDLVNEEILTNEPTVARVMPKEQALALGAMALFGEKYEDQVRVLDIGKSRELCGGTHVRRTGDIGFFKIVGQEAVAAGVRRISATTGMPALAWVHRQENTLHEVADVFKVPVGDLPHRTAQALEQHKALEKELVALKTRLALSQTTALVAEARAIPAMQDAKVLAKEIPGLDALTLRKSMDTLLPRLAPAVVVLTSTLAGKISLLVGVSPGLTSRISAKDLAQDLAGQIGGRAGGKDDLAQGGGVSTAALPAALSSVDQWLAAKLA